MNFANESVQVAYDAHVSPTDLQNALRSAGYDLIVNVENPQEAQQALQQQTLPSCETPHHGGSFADAADIYSGYVGHRLGTRPLDFVRAEYTRTVLVRTQLFHQCLEASPARQRQHGYAGRAEHRHRFSL